MYYYSAMVTIILVYQYTTTVKHVFFINSKLNKKHVVINEKRNIIRKIFITYDSNYIIPVFLIECVLWIFKNV